MGKLTFITGGCRSGKSTLAVNLAEINRGGVAFIATGLAIDEEMTERIKKHKARRPKGWVTFEEPDNLGRRLKQLDQRTVLIDCVTIYLANLLMKKRGDDGIIDEIADLLGVMRRSRSDFIIVSNEVGMGIVPATALGRRFRDLAGEVNKRLAEAADTVYLTVAGLPLKVK